jgi:hypothetical protein
MRRILSSGLMVLAGAVGPAALSPQQVYLAHVNGPTTDVRLETLQRFFRTCDCPAEAYAVEFLAVADAYDLDWRLLPSISFVESTGGKATQYNNMFGWDQGRARFASPADGIHEVGYRLANSETYRDKSLDALLSIYNPVGPYAQKVKSVMQRISPVQ